MRLVSIWQHRVTRRLVSWIYPLLKIFEANILKRLADVNSHPPMFIIGPPRSGTTLLYQVLVNRYKLAYFSNFSANFPQTPIAALWIENTLFPKGNTKNAYTSKYGITKGWQGPHECGEFWYRWFPRGKYVYVAPGETSKVHLNELARNVTGMSKVTQSSVIFKNVYNSMRIAPIVEALPQASFLVCRRNLVDTAQSILSSREDTRDEISWWSLPPKEIDVIKTHPYWEQVVEQVYYTYQQIMEDRIRFGRDRFLSIKYETLCRDTYSVLDKVEAFLISRGVKLEAYKDVPREFQMSTGQKVSDQDYQRIVAIAAQFEDPDFE
ncbi:hypothetical protein GF412_05730 [Candidatus Micrarchaeota archaeon]|nr:hypothetical protein [Candidatus Micrarchaeota archaeon]